MSGIWEYEIMAVEKRASLQLKSRCDDTDSSHVRSLLKLSNTSLSTRWGLRALHFLVTILPDRLNRRSLGKEVAQAVKMYLAILDRLGSSCV